MGWAVNTKPPPLYPRKRNRYTSYRKRSGPPRRSGRVQKISPPTEIQSSEYPVCSESLYRIHYPGRCQQWPIIVIFLFLSLLLLFILLKSFLACIYVQTQTPNSLLQNQPYYIKKSMHIIIIIIIYLPRSWATCWPVPVSRIQESLQSSTMIPSAN